MSGPKKRTAMMKNIVLLLGKMLTKQTVFILPRSAGNRMCQPFQLFVDPEKKDCSWDEKLAEVGEFYNLHITTFFL